MAIALCTVVIIPVFAYPIIIIINSTEDIPMFWNGTGWEELTTPYNTNATHNESMTMVPEGYVE